MVCNNPVVLSSVAGGDFRVPCGRCLGCRAAKSKEWAQRLLNEQAYWRTESFITLTYDDKNLPEGGKLVKSDLQLFFKRLRKNIDWPIKYYACGEYGDVTFRPHYHAIVFGIDKRDSKNIIKSWDKGERISIDTVEPAGLP